MVGAIRRSRGDERGQASVEYVLVFMAFVAMVLALGMLWHAVRDGRLLRLAEEAASHSLLHGLDVGAFQDISLF